MAEGDAELQGAMPAACKTLQTGSVTFGKATSTLTADPRAAAGRELLVDAVRYMLAGTTDILATYDGFEVRKMVRLGNHLLGQLAVAQQCTGRGQVDRVGEVAKTIKDRSAELARDVKERAGELQNVSHSDRLSRAVDRVRSASPLVVVSLKTAARLTVSDRAREGFAFAVSEMQQAISEIVTVLNFTSIDDNTFMERPGSIAHALEDVKEELCVGYRWAGRPPPRPAHPPPPPVWGAPPPPPPPR
jgi:hypothetical protein